MRRYTIEPETGTKWGVWDRIGKRWHTLPFATDKAAPAKIAATLNEEETTTAAAIVDATTLDLFGDNSNGSEGTAGKGGVDNSTRPNRNRK